MGDKLKRKEDATKEKMKLTMKSRRTICLALIFLCFALLFPTESASANVQNPEKKTIMVFAPHQDDEANMANAVMYSHAKRGDDVYVVMGFGSDDSGTGNDGYGLNRLRQSAKNMEILGIPSNHLIYLGYQKIDHAASRTGGVLRLNENGEVLQANGKPYYTFSHKAEGFQSFHSQQNNDEEWTASEAHLLADLVAVFKKYQPDVVYAINYDSHTEHRWLGSMVDQAFGIVKQTAGFENYCPRYYQSMSYQSAWGAKRDMDSVMSPNDGAKAFLESTTFFTPRNPTFVWADRVRFPVEDKMSSPDIASNLSAQAYLTGFAGTVDEDRVRQCVNGDQIFWERDTNSLGYQATVSVSSNEADKGKINDFSTLQEPLSAITSKSGYINYKWSPADDDDTMTVTLTFTKPQTIASVKLYDDYITDNQITAGVLRFSDDTTVNVGSLNNNGSATAVKFPIKTGITSVSFMITDCKGTPGLTEFEVYGPDSTKPRETDFIQIYLDKTNGSDWATKSFLYDYPVDVTSQTQTMQLGVYCYPNEAEPSDYIWKLSGGTQGITLTQRGLLTVTSEARSGVYQIQVTDRNNPSLKDEMTIQVNGNTCNPADINMDGCCDYKDLAYVLMGMDGFYQDKADVTGDGIVNAEDVNCVWEQIKFSQK